jgi:MerR family transcriptional regulator/heat shock protein HspR
MTNPYEISDDTPVYVISVAAELSGMHPQTLRSYDRLGLVSPGRSAGRGRGRRYSLRDVLVLREVQRLSQAGVSLPGIKRIMELEDELDRFRAALAEMTAEMAQLRTELESTRAVAARLAGLLRSRGAGGALVPVRDSRSGRQEAGPSAPRSAPSASGPAPSAREPGPDLPAAGAAGDPPAESA